MTNRTGSGKSLRVPGQALSFNVVVVAWGESYVSCLCDVALPSLVIEERDRPVTDPHSWTFLIYTMAQHRHTITQSLERNFPTARRSFHEIRPGDFANRYLAMADAHHHGAEISVADGARAIIIAPDAVFSRGALAYIAEKATEGKRAIMTVGPRLRQATALDAARAILSAKRHIMPRELASLLLVHQHPELQRYRWESDNFSSRPFMLLWDAPNGWLCRSFHLHPLMIDFSSPTTRNILRRDTIDGEFIGESVGIWDDIEVVQDSDDLLVCTFTSDDVFYSYSNLQRASVGILRRFAYDDPIINPLHRWFLTKAIRIHAGDLDTEWRALEERTGRLAFDILSTRSPVPATVLEDTSKSPDAPEPADAVDTPPPFGRVLGLWWRLRLRIRGATSWCRR